MKIYANTEWKEVDINGGKQNIPKDWDCENLDSLGKLNRGKSKHRPRNDPRLFGNKYPFIQTSEVKEAKLWLTNKPQKYYSEFGLKQSKLWDEGTLCITIAANIAESSILTYKACFPDSVLGFIPNENVNNVFVKYQIDILKSKMKDSSKGSAQDNLNLDKINLFKLPIPKPEEQENIVSILLSQESIIQKTKDLIKNLEKRNHFMMDELLSGSIRIKQENEQLVFYKNPNDNWQTVKINGEDIDIPTDWSKTFLGSSNIPFVKSGVKKYDGILDYYATGEVNDFSLRINSTGSFTYDKKPSRANVKVLANAVYLARMKNTLKIIKFEKAENFLLSTGFLGLQPNVENVSLDYLYYTVRSDNFQKIKNKECKGATQETLSDSAAEKIEILVPCIEEQRLIAITLKNMFSELEKHKQILEKEEKTFTFLLEELMSGRLRIKI